ncbi:MAG TPA: hypothetical protein ENG66_07440 [Thermococcus sp.]|nr:hypothetical protein [Thermococcus sp.]
MKNMASVSGGKDSMAMALRLWELGHKFTIVSVFTEFEFPAIKQQVYKLIDLTGLPYIILETPKGTWLVLKTHYPELFKIALKYHHDNLKLVGIPIIPNGIEFQKASSEVME